MVRARSRPPHCRSTCLSTSTAPSRRTIRPTRSSRASPARHRWPPALGPRPRRRQQRLDCRPEIVGNQGLRHAPDNAQNPVSLGALTAAARRNAEARAAGLCGATLEHECEPSSTDRRRARKMFNALRETVKITQNCRFAHCSRAAVMGPCLAAGDEGRRCRPPAMPKSGPVSQLHLVGVVGGRP